jgi:hypothetical protein
MGKQHRRDFNPLADYATRHRPPRFKKRGISFAVVRAIQPIPNRNMHPSLGFGSTRDRRNRLHVPK